MSLNFHWSRKWYELFTSCNVFCMQALHFRNFQIRASLCCPCHYIFRAYTTTNLKETCSLQGPVHCFQNVHHKQPQQVMNFSLFLLALYQLWDNFLVSEMTGIDVNNTKNTPCQPQRVHCLGMLIYRKTLTLPQWRDFRLRTRCIWDLRSFGILRSVDWWFFCRRFETTVGDWEIPTAVLVKIQVIWDVAPCWPANLPSSGSTVPRWRHCVPPKRP